MTCGGLMAAAAAADPTEILGVEIAEGGGNGGGATTWIPATDGGTGLESVLKEKEKAGRKVELVLQLCFKLLAVTRH